MKHALQSIFLVTLCIACSDKKESTSADSESSRVFALQRDNFFSSLRDPDQVSDRLQTDIIQFDSTLLSDPEVYYKYAGNNIMAAANLGIYLSDLNYCILYKRPDQVKRYFMATHELSKMIQIEKSTLEFMMQRYESNLANNDSLKTEVVKLLNQSVQGLKETDRERLAGIIMAGYQVENLYLVLTILTSLPDELTEEQHQMQKLLLQYILEQREKFEVVYHFIRANSDPLDPERNPNYPYFDNALRELLREYQQVTENDPQLFGLLSKIKAIRDKIIRV